MSDDKMTEDEIYEAAIDKWGREAQADMIIEECSELIQAICKYKRGLASIDDVAEEIADVKIMARQSVKVYECETAVDRFVIEKLNRLKNNIQEEI